MVNLLLISRIPVPQPSLGAGGSQSSLCELRGHCGPFVNERYYDAFPEAQWHGMADCLECGSTRCVGREPSRADLGELPSAA